MGVSYTGELIGRDGLLETLSKRLDMAIKGKGCIDFLLGDAGIGKTSIINKFTDLHPEAHTLYVQCSALTDADDLYKPCSDLLNSIETIKWQEKSKVNKLLGTLNLEKVVDVGGKILGFIPGLELPSAIIDLAISAYAGESNPEALAESYKNDKVKLYSDILLGLSIKKPLIVVFDDLHWADRGTINVIKHIFQIMLESRQGINSKKFNLLLIGSFRDAEAKADSLHNGIKEMFSFINRYNIGNGQRLMAQHEVNELNKSAIQQLITYYFDNDEIISDGLKRWLYECSNGNPLLLSNLIDVLRENSAVESSNNGWVDFNEVYYSSNRPILKGRMLRLEKQGAFKSKSVVALEALRNLTDTELKIMYVASIFREYFTIESLAYVCKIKESDLYWPINRLIKMGFIIELGELDNGVEVQSRYHIKSKGLIEALRNDMSVHQICYYEEALGAYYDIKIDAVNNMEDTVVSLDLSEVVSKAVISEKYTKISKVRDFYHKMASYHYMKGKNSLKAIEHGLAGVKRLVDRYKETKGQIPSPLELDGLRKTIESQISLYDILFDNVIDELIFVKDNQNELIQQLKIRALTSYAEFYACFEQYTKASEYLNTALMLTKFTESEIDDAELMIAVAEINLNSGNHTKAIEMIGKLLDYIEDTGDDWDEYDLETIINSILDLIRKDSVLQAEYISRITEIAISLNSEIIVEAQFAELEFYLEHNKMLEANMLIERIDSLHPDIIWGYYLNDILTKLELLKIPKDEAIQFKLFSNDDVLQHNFYLNKEYAWRFNACNVILPILLQEIKEVEGASLSYSILNTLRVLAWLKQFSRLNESANITDFIDDKVLQDIYKQRILRLKLHAKTILDINKDRTDLSFIYSWFCKRISTGLYIDERDDILAYLLTYWPEVLSANHINWLFDISMNSSAITSHYANYEKNIIAWSEYYQLQPNIELAKLIVNSLEQQIHNLGKNILTSKVIVELLFAVDDFKKLIDINSYVELGIDVCLDYGEYDRAEAIQKYILGETSNKLIDKIHKHEYKSIDISVHPNDINLFSYDGEDSFSKFITAEKLTNRADYIIASGVNEYLIDALQLYVQSYNLMEHNEYAETTIDDVCDKISKCIGRLNNFDLRSLESIFSATNITSDMLYTRLLLQLKYQYKSLKINQGVGDLNRVVDCLVSMIETIEAAIDIDKLSVDDINSALKETKFTVDTLFVELDKVLVVNTMFNRALELYIDFSKRSSYKFSDSYKIPTITLIVNKIMKNIDNPILIGYVNELLTIKNPY